ncbi:MAG: hypothetical protein HY815_15175 [Candidatus Riflebacteria bacterium]|nr:hypothetical protein [Candidatus Riflebacteria bacterium]
MEDPTVFVRVQNRAGQNINCSVDQNQFMANADEYLLKIRMPSEGFLKFEPRDVRVDFFYGCWVNVWGSSGSRQVEIKIPRRNFGYGFSVNIRVTIPTDAELQQMKREALRKANFDTLEARSRP